MEVALWPADGGSRPGASSSLSLPPCSCCREDKPIRPDPPEIKDGGLRDRGFSKQKKSNSSCDLHFLVQADRTFLEVSGLTGHDKIFVPFSFSTPPTPKNIPAIFEERFAKAFFLEEKKTSSSNSKP